jgi:hypothetical protein
MVKFALGVLIMFSLGIDAALYLMFGITGTISQVVVDAPPSLLMFISFLLGHWTLPMSRSVKNDTN